MSVLIFSVSSAHAFFSPVSLAVFPGLQFPGAEYTVAGLRASLFWGRQRDIYGLDLGVLGNITEQDFTGIGLSGLFNMTHGVTRVIGLQAALGMNMTTNKTTVYGLQLAGLLNSNEAASSLIGFGVALVNLSPNMDIMGVQLGVYNKALAVYGLQIGIVNVCKNLHGLQIGLVNFHEMGAVNVSPILNIGF